MARSTMAWSGARGGALSRCLDGGDFVPVYRKGRLVRIDWRANDRLAIAILSGKDRDIGIWRRRAQSRWSMAQGWRAVDAERGEKLLAEARDQEKAADAVEAVTTRVARHPRVRGL